MWMFLAALVSLQMYFVWELLAVFALFAVGFAAIAFAVGSLYMLHRGWALAVERIADSRHPVMVAMRQGIGRGAHRGEPASGYGGHAAGHRHDRRRGAQNDSASGFCASPLGS